MPRSGNRGLALGALLVAAGLGLAVLKPWAGIGSPAYLTLPSARPADVVAPSPEAPAVTPPGYSAPGGQCFPGSDWRVFTIETHGGRALRTWLSVTPGDAGSPQDPVIPFVSVVTDRLLALGFCVGSGQGGPGPLAGARAWAIDAVGAAVPLDLAPLVAYMPHEPDLGAVYQPPAEPGGTAGVTWSPGRYVFAVNQGPATGDAHWFGVEVVAAPTAPANP
jgi:hypothetical protein